MISPLLAAMLATSAPSERIAPVYTIRQEGGGLGFWVEETVVLAGAYPAGTARGEPRFWIVEQRRADREIGRPAAWTMRHRWIDGRTCPALADVVRGLRSLWIEAAAKVDAQAARAEAASRFGIPPMELPSIPPYRSDTPEVSVTGREGAGMADVGGPVSEWWRGAGRAIEGCWQSGPPVANGGPVQPLISGPWVVRQRY